MSVTALGAAAGPAQASFTTTLAAGGSHTCAVETTGAVKCWGTNSYGQLGDGTTANKASPTAVSGLSSGVTAITAGGGHTCALLTTGAVKCWGYNYSGQIGDGTTANKDTPTDVLGLSSGVTAITAGANDTCALLSTGAVKCWGNNWAGELGDGTTANKDTPTAVSGLSSGVTAITAGGDGFGDHTCALLTTGAVKCWGYNYYGQIGDGTTANKDTPTDVSGLSSGVTAISAGGYDLGDHTCALLTTGAVKCWGDNGNGQLGDGTTAGKTTPTAVSGLSSGVTAISAGGYHTCALLTTGAVKCWGYNGNGELGDGTTVDKASPTAVSGLSTGVTAITAGGGHTCALLTTGAVKCWGYNSSGQIGDGTTGGKFTPTDVSGLSSGVTAITAGDSHTCALLSTGAVKCWGANWVGQLGDGTTASKDTPTDVSGLSSGVTAITAGEGHTCALLSTGAVKCWGGNGGGQLGDGTTAGKTTPTDVSGLSSGVTAITAGFGHTCALLSTGAVKCWGDNQDGQLGDGTTVRKTTPTDVSGLSSGVTAITAGEGHTCALLSTGAVKCWGDNSAGQLGDGTTAGKTTPTDVLGLSSGVSAITAGAVHTCALLSTGAVKCWGDNTYGQLGDGTTANKTTPTDVSGLSSGVSAITAGYRHTCALLSTGAVKCWGYNYYGQLGDGTTAGKTTPTDVSGLSSGVTAITADDYHTCALLSTGAVKCWGNNSNGQLGDGTAFAEIPISVLGLTDVAQPGEATAAPPTVAITTPPDGASYAQGAIVNASFTCTAGTGATISSCVGTVANGAAINTTAGSHSFTVTATDSLGQSTTASTTYTVSSGTAPPPGGSGTPPSTAPPTTTLPTTTLISGKPIVAKAKNSVTVPYVCAKASCVITVTIKIGKKKYTFKSKSLPKSMSSTPVTQTISIPSKIAKQIKAAKKKRLKVKVTAAIS